jgi:two-component system, sensor histidine kinase and response regulator
MPKKPATQQKLLAENEDLRARLEKAEETLREILSGEADALFVSGVGGAQLFTLKGTDKVYRTLINNMSEGALTLTPEGLVLYANRRFAEMLRAPLEKVIGSGIHAWFAPESRQVLQTLLRKDTLDNHREELTLVAADGTQVPVYLSVSRLLIDEMPDSFCMIATDLTEQKRSEAIIASEKLAQELLAAANQSRRALLSVVEDQKRAEEDVRKLNSELEAKVIARTDELDRARSTAEQANHAKSDFLSAMSHEIRTPMNGVIGMVEVLQQSSLNPAQMEMTNIIRDSAFALLTVIDDILDISKIEAGKLHVESLPMDIENVVEKVCATLDRMALKKGVELTMFIDPFLPEQVMGDPGRLRQILVNLANNAIKFSSGQGRQARVSVSATRMDEGATEKVMVEFCVADNGIGIDEATQARLFTPFTQADSSTTRNFGGTGLGLAICRQLVKIKGGEISVHSELGKGAVFIVRLPFLLMQNKTEADAQPSPVTGLNCLVMGGADSMAGDIAAYLAHAGAAVEQAPDMAAARQWVNSRTPGLCIVVIDITAVNLLQATSLLDDLRAAFLEHMENSPEHGIRFVLIRRGKRREPRLEAVDLALVDGNVLTRKALLKSVAVAAGRIQLSDQEDEVSTAPEGAVKTIFTPLSREEASKQGSLILIAEDNEINQKVIRQQLKLLGQTADIASNGREALELWQSGGYGIVLADLHMPEMDGYALTAAIRAGEAGKPRTPIIAFTANAVKGVAERCSEAGMDDYLSKPVQLATLKAMLEKWLPMVASDPIPVGAISTLNDSSGVGRALPADEESCRATSTGSGQAKPDLQLPFAAASASVDVNVLRALVGDDEETIRDILKDFRVSADNIAAELRAACKAEKTSAVAATAHKLKSSARSVGALALGELCYEMEQAGKDGDIAALAALLPRFEMELGSVERYLNG